MKFINMRMGELEKKLTKECNSAPTEYQIMHWIDEHQSGKSGIYPHHVALEICAEFGIPLTKAKIYVLAHIKKILDGGEQSPPATKEKYETKI